MCNKDLDWAPKLYIHVWYPVVSYASSFCSQSVCTALKGYFSCKECATQDSKNNLFDIPHSQNVL